MPPAKIKISARAGVNILARAGVNILASEGGQGGEGPGVAILAGAQHLFLLL